MTSLLTPPTESDVPTTPTRPPRTGRSKVGRWVLFIAMMAIAVIMLYPFWVMIVTSLKSEAQFLAGQGFSWLSWTGLTATIPIGQEVLSSTIVCAASIFIILLVGLPAGFAFSKLRFRTSSAVFLVIVSAMMVPLQAILMPEFVNVTKLGLTGGYSGAILVYAALGTPFSVFLFTTYFRGVPDELIEAGIVDGLSYFGALWRLVVPIAVPAIATVTVLQFIQIWDDLLVGLLFIQNTSERPITVGLAVLAAGRTTSIPELMAGSLISALPAMLVYLAFQRYLVKGLTMGIDR
ncbi:MAG TPA: carbohydrate ABC transporter permease [Acidimicrobiales bacterium]|jgi:multiple sugar transport system permease protein/raffinose/stachyose/melibiose transport system permease protein|nr:carbohydrate ABC transporter permease [Acidimicrobiales bacterium]